MTEHTQSTVEDARRWREVIDDLASIMDRDLITPELVTAAVRKQLRVGADYYAPEFAGFVYCYEDARR